MTPGLRSSSSVALKARAKGSAGAFSLLELMVAVAVLSLLVVLVSQLVSGASQTTTKGRRLMEAEAQARLALDRMGADLAAMVRRSDVDYLFLKQNGSDRLFFFSQAPGFFDASRGGDPSGLSLIGYRVNDKHQLERLGKALSFSDIAFKVGNSTAGDMDVLWPASVSANSNDPDWGVLADNVFRLEFQLVRRSDGQILSPSAPVRSLDDLAAIIVTVGVLDSVGRKITSDMGSVAAALPDSGTTNLASAWQDEVESGGFSGGVLPASAAANVRIYQRTFMLDPQ